jgi:hypothetical protein
MSRRLRTVTPAPSGKGAGAGAGAAAAGAGAGAATASGLYVYFTALSGSPRSAPIFVADIGAGWTSGEKTDLTRSDLEKEIIKNAGLCGTNVSETYLRDNLPYSKNSILLMISSDKITLRARGDSSVPSCNGFILARFLELPPPDKKGVYLDIICAGKGLGGKFLAFFHNFVFDNGANFVKLSSLANVLTYYPKLGYNFRKSCAGEPLQVLPPTLSERDYKVKPMPADTYVAYGDKNYMNFMYDKLYKESDLGVRNAEDCKKTPRDLTRVQFKMRDCAQDGFTMMKCTRGGRRKVSRRTRRAKRSHRR